MLFRSVVEAIVITGSNIGDIVYRQTICLTATDPKWPFTLHRRQFPIRNSYGVTSEKALRILTEKEYATCCSETRNIVFSEIFQSLA